MGELDPEFGLAISKGLLGLSSPRSLIFAGLRLSGAGGHFPVSQISPKIRRRRPLLNLQ
jgi:hypothetical protein